MTVTVKHVRKIPVSVDPVDVSMHRLFRGFPEFSIQTETWRENRHKVDSDNNHMFKSSKLHKKKLTKEHEDGAEPLHRTQDVSEQNDRTEDREELPSGGDDGAGQRPEVHHRHENKRLRKTLRFTFFKLI